MRTVIKEFRKVLEKWDEELYDDYKDIDIDDMYEEVPWSRERKDREASKMSSDKDFLLELMEANGKLIDMIAEYEEAE